MESWDRGHGEARGFIGRRCRANVPRAETRGPSSHFVRSASAAPPVWDGA